MRNLVVVAITAVLCLLSPLRPVIGVYGYYWFGLMRPDVLAWSGPNNYSFFIAVATLLSNFASILRNLAILFSNSICRNLILLVFVITLSVLAAVNPSLCYQPYWQFVRVMIMALIIPLVLTASQDLQWFFVVVAGSIGLLGAKYGLAGVLAGGAIYAAGYGGMMDDNNTMALAFAMAVPMCWFARLLVSWKPARLGLAAAGLLCMAAVVFTHSRGGVLSVATAILLITFASRRKLLAGLLLLSVSAGIAYLVWDSFTRRMSTLRDVEAEDSAKSRIILAQSSIRLWLDYPFLGVGFTENNERNLIFKYVPPEYAVEYAGKVIHNTYAQMLVDSGIFALLLYVWLLASTAFRCWRAGHRVAAEQGVEAAAIPYGVAVTLATYGVGATFLSRTAFDMFYVLLMIAAAWFEIQKKRVPVRVEVLPAAPAPVPPPDHVEAPDAPSGHVRFGLTRIRRPRAGGL